MRKIRNKLLKSFTVIFTVVGLFSCSHRPSNALNEKEMVNLMADMEITESYINSQGSLSAKEREEMGKRILAAHGVSEEALDTTLAWYGRNMDEYSELFEKVDKEIMKRRKKFTEIENQNLKVSDDLWTFGEHLTISPLSGSDAFSFSILHPEIEKGDIIKLSFFLPNSTNLKNTIGVEYQDGYGEALVNNSSKNKVEIDLQTDSSKVVSRIFATIHVKDLKALPLYLDSISIKGEPIDTLNYRSKRRSQKNFGPF